MRNKSLDGLRGIAALSVAIGHCITHLYGLSAYPLTFRDFHGIDGMKIAIRLSMSVFNADAAVILFFVLSGHVLSRSLEARAQGLDYLVRRAFRLLPVGIVTAVPFILYMRPNALDALGTALLVNHSVNGVIWSLQIELVGSALIFVLWMIGSRSAAILAALAFIGAALAWDNWIALFLPSFCLGFLVPSLPECVGRSRAAVISALIVLLFADILLGRSVSSRLVEMAAAWVLVGCVASSPPRMLESRSMLFLGDVSFPFYLLHPFFMMVIGVHVSTSLLGFLSLTAMSVSAALVISWIIHRTIEKPAIAAGNAMLKNHRRHAPTVTL